MGSFVANISNSISATAQALFNELWIAYIAPLNFYGLIISVVGVLVVIIVVHLLLVMVRDLKQMTKLKMKSKWLEVRRYFSTGNQYVNTYFVMMVRDLKQMTKLKMKSKWLGVRRDFSTDVENSRMVHVSDLDAALAEELQFQEALLVSLYTAPTVNEEASSSVLALLSTAPTDNEATSSVQGGSFPKSFCEICLEDKGKWQMIEHDECSHSFCSECMSKHIIARVEANMLEVNCPGINCRTLLNASHYRHLVPKETLVRWDEAVCKSMYVDSQKLYCPYRDCSAMLVNDTGEAMGKSTCPLCKRSFCAACQVPWHSEFTCKKFKKLNTQKKKEDAMVMTLAKKKQWQKCPQCKMLVEKSEGCIHMTCRCNHQFCYRCGGKWSPTHEACYFKLGMLANRTFGKLLVR